MLTSCPTSAATFDGDALCGHWLWSAFPRSHWLGADWLVRIRERDTTGQLIGQVEEVIATVIELVNGTIDWAEACNRLPAYDGVQAVE